jgi:hypothetical protein
LWFLKKVFGKELQMTEKRLLMCRRVVKTNNLVFSFFLQTNILIGYLTVGDGRSKFEVVCCFFRNNMISIFLLGSVRVMRKSTLVLQGSNLPEDIYVS